MNSGYSEAFPLKRDRSIKGKWQNSSFCLEMSCTVNDELEVSKTISFPSINWSVKPSTGGPNFVWVIVWLFWENLSWKTIFLISISSKSLAILLSWKSIFFCFVVHMETNFWDQQVMKVFVTWGCLSNGFWHF